MHFYSYGRTFSCHHLSMFLEICSVYSVFQTFVLCYPCSRRFVLSYPCSLLSMFSVIRVPVYPRKFAFSYTRFNLLFTFCEVYFKLFMLQVKLKNYEDEFSPGEINKISVVEKRLRKEIENLKSEKDILLAETQVILTPNVVHDLCLF